MYPFVTEEAIHIIARSPSVIGDLCKIPRQSFDETLIVRVSLSRPGGCIALSGAQRDKYAEGFQAMQRQQATINVVTRHDPKDGGKLQGFVICALVGVGLEHLYAFCWHGGPGDERISLAVASDEREARKFISEVGKVHSLAGGCCWCGSKGKFKRCPCKAVWYCNGDCQTQHWKLHTPKCAFQK